MAFRIITPRGASLQTRLALRSAPQPNGCIHFIGAEVGKTGRGQLFVDGKSVLAPRAAYECFVGPIPDGMNVLHACDNPQCIGTGHLFLGTQVSNVEDMVAKGRQRGAVGERNTKAKLTVADVISIRSSTDPRIVLARRYGVASSLITKIKSREVWRHI